MKEVDSLRAKLKFDSVYDMLDRVARLVREGEAHEFLNYRSMEAHEYCQNYLMPDAWGKNVWHAILDDAIRMRKELKNDSK